MGAHTVVFLGPSLPLDEARTLVDAEFHPPARMGDVYRLMSARVRRFVIIDGVFHGVPSVWHREIIDAMAEGIAVIGAASMGALRAAELHRFGMIGHGTVFAWYREGVIDADDEVALLHGDADTGYRAVSEPLVNLRSTLAALCSSGVIADADRDALVAWLKARHYPERSRRALVEAPVVRTWGADRQRVFRTALETDFRDIKRDDARGVLAWCAERRPSFPAKGAPVSRRPEHVMWRIGRVLRGTSQKGSERVSGEALLRTHAGSPNRDVELARRAFVVAWAEERGIACPAGRVQRAHAEWQRDRRPSRMDEGDFLAAAGLTAVRAQQLLSERALVDWLVEQGPEAFGLVAGDSDEPAAAFIEDWARGHGVTLAASAIVARGPSHFGLPFHRDAALVEELRMTGEALV